MNKDEIVQALQKHQYNQIQADGVLCCGRLFHIRIYVTI